VKGETLFDAVRRYFGGLNCTDDGKTLRQYENYPTNDRSIVFEIDEKTACLKAWREIKGNGPSREFQKIGKTVQVSVKESGDPVAEAIKLLDEGRPASTGRAGGTVAGARTTGAAGPQAPASTYRSVPASTYHSVPASTYR